MISAQAGEAANSVEASAEGGVKEMPSMLSVLAVPKQSPSSRPLRAPSTSAPVMTGTHRMVTLMKPSGISPSGVMPSTNTSAIKSAAAVMR